MKTKLLIFAAFLLIISVTSCKTNEKDSDMNIIFLHHSTGEFIWNGAPPSFIKKAAGKISEELASALAKKGRLPNLFEKYNEENDKNYLIKEMEFPKASPYGWNNYPFDYYNIWVKNAGEQLFNEEPTLEILTKDYQVIIFKHCYPVSSIEEDQDSADINSYVHTVSNYKLQYSAIRDKLHSFPGTKFILFTGAARVQSELSEEEGLRAREFFTWVKEEWDMPGDNIYLWDLYSLETEGGLYLKEEYAMAPDDSHPNANFAGKAVELLFNRIIDVIENDGEGSLVTGEKR